MVSPRTLPPYVERLFDPVYRPPFCAGKARLFILAVDADADRLQTVVDTYLNAPTGGHVQYEVTERFVLLMFAELGDMGSKDPRDRHRGTVTERELSIWLPMRHRVTRLPAWYMPYVFNSEPSAVTTGREVYGYPKIYTPDPRFDLGPDSWPADFGLRLPYFGDGDEAFTVKELVTLERLSEEQAPAGTGENVTVSSRKAPYTTELGTVISAKQEGPEQDGSGSAPGAGDTPPPRLRLRLSQGDPSPDTDAVQPASGAARMSPGRPPTPFSKAGGVGRILRSLSQAGPEERAYGLLKYAPLVFLKQFRDAEYPDRACYQAVVQSHLVLEGDRPLSSVDTVDDPGAAYRLGLPNTPDFPIVSELGLSGDGDGDRRTVPVRSMIRVSTPFSIDVGRVIWHRGG